MVSVPTKGTHLLYELKRWGIEQEEEFPSPRRGPIFSTIKKKGKPIITQFPSPRRGPIFSTLGINSDLSLIYSFRPHEGDPSSLQG